MGTRPLNVILGAAAAVLLVAGWAAATWTNLWAFYAWGAQDESWVLVLGGVTVVALALPVAFLVGDQRWQRRHGPSADLPGVALRVADATCGSLAAVFCLISLASTALFGYLAWVFWTSGAAAASGYFVVVGLAVLVEPVALLVHYDRWQSTNGLR